MSSAGVQPQQRIESPAKKGTFALPGKSTLILGLLLLAATTAVYLQVHRHPFVNLDDDDYVTNNAHVQSGLDWKTIKWALTTYNAFNWHPLTWISHAVDVQVFGLNPSGHHDVNLALHLLNVVLVFWVLWRATGYAGRSLMVAALFALHPLNVESVAWIAERKTMLSMFFFLLALGAYRWYACKPRLGRYIVVAFLFGMGLLAKPQVITFPCVLLIWDYWPLGRLRLGDSQPESAIPAKNLSWLVVEKLPLFALCLISAYLTMKAQKVGRPVYWSFTFLVRLENAIVAYARYIQKAFWPSNLALMYPHPGNNIPIGQVIAALIFLVAVTAVVAVCWRRRYLTVGWLWFLGTMVPMVGLVQVGRQSMADRYAYLPFVGLFIMLCWGVADWARARQVPDAWLMTASLVVLASLAVITHRQAAYWADNEKLWSHTVQVTKGNWFAEYHLGDALRKKGEKEEALQHFFKVLAIDPAEPNANLAIATYEHEAGHLRESIPYYEKFLATGQEKKLQYQVMVNLGYVYRRLGDDNRSREYFEKAAAIAPR